MTDLKNDEVRRQQTNVIGAWITAIGTIAAAIASVPMRSLEGEAKERWDDASEALDFSGNAFQAIGNFVEAFNSEDFTLEVAGEIIQASGNVTVLFSIITKDNEEKKIVLDITGNAQQAFGGLLAALDEIGEIVEEGGGDPTAVIGNILQSIGNTLQAIAGMIDLEILKKKELIDEIGEAEVEDGLTVLEYAIESEKNTLDEEVKQMAQLSELVKYSGSWIQAGGSIISAVAEQKELRRLIRQKEIENEKKIKRKKKKKKKKKKRPFEEKKKNTSQQFTQVIKKNISEDYTEIRKKS